MRRPVDPKKGAAFWKPHKCRFSVGDVVYYRKGHHLYKSRIKEITLHKNGTYGYILLMEDGNKSNELKFNIFKTHEEAIATIEKMRRSIKRSEKILEELKNSKEEN